MQLLLKNLGWIEVANIAFTQTMIVKDIVTTFRFWLLPGLKLTYKLLYGN